MSTLKQGRPGGTRDGMLSLIHSWRASLGLQPAQSDTALPEMFQEHAAALRQALREESVQDWEGIEAVFRTAVELCIASSGRNDLLSTNDTDLSTLTAPAALGARSLHTQPSSSSLSELDSSSLSHHADETASAHACNHDDKASTVGSMVGEREFVRPVELFVSTRTSIEIYERFGGWDLFSGAVGEMYCRLSNDPMTASFFQNRPRERLMQHMTGFLSSAMLGRCMYKPEELLRVHCPMIQNEGLGPQHVDVMTKHMEEVLRDLGATEETVHAAVRVLQSQKYIFDRVDVHESEEENPSEAEAPAEVTEAAERVPFEADDVPAKNPAGHGKIPAACPFAAHALSAEGAAASPSTCPFMSATKALPLSAHT